MYVPEIEISVRFKNKPNELLTQIRRSQDVYNLAMNIFNADQIEWVEEFVMLSLNSISEVIGYYKVSKGGVAATYVDVKVIATIALQTCATSVIIMHNHPSGGTNPSEADKSITLKIKDALQLLNIRLYDHLVVSNKSYFSFSDEGLI